MEEMLINTKGTVSFCSMFVYNTYTKIMEGGLQANIIRPYDGVDYGRYGIKNTSPALQNVLKIPREGAFLVQGRINAPPHQQHAA